MRLNIIIFISLALYSCSGIQKSALNNRFSHLENSFDHHVGFALYDPVKKKMIYEYNGDRYFTPASNTKILTLYTALKTLPDSLITFYYKESGDSLLLWPAGDPTFLNPEFPSSRVYDRLKNSEKEMYFSFSHNNIKHFGPGWSWDDYTSYYSVERSALPVYGNYFSVGVNNSKLHISVPYFKPYIWLSDSTSRTRFRREAYSNITEYHPGKNNETDTFKVAFQTSPWLSYRLLTDTLKKPLYLFNSAIDKNALPLKSLPVDTAYKKMMQESNNFVAEQLLIQCSVTLFDTLDSRRMIDFALENYLNFLPQEPRWVDGSGLSRYNLITPASTVALWDKLLEEHPRSKLFPLLATGGVSGTIKNYYKASIPYIFGKTGTLSNNHVLSGYLITKSGRLLIFSFMNNNYPGSSGPVKKQMEEILWEVHLNN